MKKIRFVGLDVLTETIETMPEKNGRLRKPFMMRVITGNRIR